MHTLTRRERIQRRKGLRGKGWGLSRKHRRPSPHIFHTQKWVVIPSVGNAMAFLTEHKALHVAAAIARETKENVEVDHQQLNEAGEWVSVEGE
jgi:hypothetical protein